MRRRAFIHSTLGAVAVSAIPSAPLTRSISDDSSELNWLPIYREVMSKLTDLEVLGIPASWWHVHHGLHPFSLERVIILDQPPEERLEEQFRKRLLEGLSPKFYHWDGEASRYLVHIAFKLAQIYRVPHYAEEWAGRCVKLHMMGDHFFHPGFGLIYNLQAISCDKTKLEDVSTVNGLVDWWLFLIPSGFLADTLLEDERRTHILFVPVFPNGMPIEFWFQIYRFLQDIAHHILKQHGGEWHDFWADLSRMDRSNACLFLNQNLAKVIRQISDK